MTIIPARTSPADRLADAFRAAGFPVRRCALKPLGYNWSVSRMDEFGRERYGLECFIRQPANPSFSDMSPRAKEVYARWVVSENVRRGQPMPWTVQSKADDSEEGVIVFQGSERECRDYFSAEAARRRRQDPNPRMLCLHDRKGRRVEFSFCRPVHVRKLRPGGPGNRRGL